MEAATNNEFNDNTTTTSEPTAAVATGGLNQF